MTAESVSELVARMAWLALIPESLPGVLDWAGLTEHPTEPVTVVAQRHGVHPQSILQRNRRVKRSTNPDVLSPQIKHEASRQTRDGENHLARQRWAQILQCDRPQPAATGPSGPSTADQRLARQSAQILAAVGSLELAELVECVQQRHLRSGRTIAPAHLTAALTATGLAHPRSDGRWWPASPIAALPRPLALLAAAARTGRQQHTTDQISDLLLEAGYTNGGGVVLAYHPLIRHVGRSHWEVRGGGSLASLVGG